MATETQHPMPSVTSEKEERHVLRQHKLYTVLQYTEVPSSWLLEKDVRFDASYYTSDVISVLNVLYHSGINIQPLSDLVDKLFYPGRFKRIYAQTKTDGKAFLTASSILHFRPTSNKYLAHTSGAVQLCTIEPRLILITRSGTVGRCVISGKKLAQFAISDDVVRIKANNVLTGYLYAYLASRFGQALLTKDQYGSAIKHLEPHHIAGIPVPLLPNDEQRAIHKKIMHAYELRDEANALLDTANSELHTELGIPYFDDTKVPYLPVRTVASGELHPPPQYSFTVSSADLQDRFDASYHVPVVKYIIDTLKNGKYALTTIGAIAKQIVVPPRFKRNYVDKGFGIPFLQGSHLSQMSPQDMKYLSQKHTKGVHRWKIYQDQVLVTCSGTIGRVSLVSRYWNEWAASQHILRITTSQDVHPGYVTAFLLSLHGYHQIIAKTYGAVVDELTELDMGKVVIPDAPYTVQESIGNKVREAYEKKDMATAIEEEAIKDLERRIEQYHQRSKKS